MFLANTYDMRQVLYFLISSLFMSLCCCTTGPDQEQDRQPNMVVVLVDDLRWDEYSMGGHSYIQTPNIDRLVKNGLVFQNAFATTPLCSPSRASFLTGQYAHSHGITDNTERSIQSHLLQTFPMKLDSLGYETAFIGKWHMGNDHTPRPGFDFWACLEGQGEAMDPALNVNGQMNQHNGYVTDILTNLALDFISERDEHHPFLVYLSHKGLHPNLYQDATGKVENIGGGGFIPAPRHRGMYADEVLDRRPNAFVTPVDKPALMRKIEGLPDLGRETGTPEQVIRERGEMLMAIDEGLGELMTLLEEKGELDNTVIVFAGDHGYWYGEHGLNEERRLAYEEGLRIPLIFQYPALIDAGSQRSEMVLNIDLAPTLIQLAGGEPSHFIEGQSLVPLLKGEAPANWRKAFLMEYYTDAVWPRMVQLGYKGIRTDRYKYIRYVELEGMDEFYDLGVDPYEMSNSIDDPRYSAVISELKTTLTKLSTK